MEPCRSGVLVSGAPEVRLRGVSVWVILDRKDLRRCTMAGAGLLLLLARMGVAILASMLPPVASIVFIVLSPASKPIINPEQTGKAARDQWQAFLTEVKSLGA